MGYAMFNFTLILFLLSNQYLYLFQAIKIARYVCVLVILPTSIMILSIYLDIILSFGIFGPPAFLYLFYGVFVPGIKIIASPRIRKFVKSGLVNTLKVM